MDTNTHLNTLREFFKEGRNTPHNLSYEEQDKFNMALGNKMVAWAKGIDTDTGKAPKTLEEAVVKAAACVIKACDLHGMKPGWEVIIFPPEQKDFDGSGSWRICWESGPFEWGVGDSLGANTVVPYRYCSGKTFYTEPWYSFDLCFQQSFE